jgi:hypothetical protein
LGHEIVGAVFSCNTAKEGENDAARREAVIEEVQRVQVVRATR